MNEQEQPRSVFPRMVSCDALICFSHLRWSFVFQRPQHLMSRFARLLPVYFFEEPVSDPTGGKPHLVRLQARSPCWFRTYRSTSTRRRASRPIDAQRVLLDSFIARSRIARPLLWYYTPVALAFSDHLDAAATVYDCMDELTGFVGAPPQLREMEERLFRGRAWCSPAAIACMRPSGPCTRISILSRAASMRSISAAPVSALPSPRTRPRSRILGSATAASSTSAWTWT